MALLDDLEEDAFKELFNLSFGKAAATLSEMVDAEVLLSVPCFTMLPKQSVTQHIQELYGLSIGLVSMPYRLVFASDNTLTGMAVLMIRAADIAHFLDALYGTPIPEAMVAQVEQEAMQLVGDVLLYTCASSLSALFASEIDSERPKFFKGSAGHLAEYLALPALQSSVSDPVADEGGSDLLMLRIDFALLGKEVSGSLLTWMDGQDLPGLKAEIDHCIVACLT